MYIVLFGEFLRASHRNIRHVDVSVAERREQTGRPGQGRDVQLFRNGEPQRTYRYLLVNAEGELIRQKALKQEQLARSTTSTSGLRYCNFNVINCNIQA